MSTNEIRSSDCARVRQGTAADHAQIVAWNRAMALETEGVVLDEAVVSAGVAAVLSGGAPATYRIATLGDADVGQLMVTREWSDWRNADVWWIQSVYVAPPWRGRSVYQSLHQDVLSAARASGAAGLRLYVDRRNVGAQATYARLGMTGDHYAVFEQMFDPQGAP